MNRPRFAAVILAGGLSTRMKQLKPLLPLGKTSVLNHVIGNFVQANVDVILVTGFHRQEIEAGVENRSITIIYNPEYVKGMFTSVQAGINVLKPEYRAFFVLPVDIPLVSPETIKELTVVGQLHPNKIIYPVFNGQRGHPPLIPSLLIPDILGWQKGGGLKTVLEKYKQRELEVPVNDKYILFDIDTPEDYLELLDNYQQL
jgi:molybdenum cofactor cytidylyltransferase